MKIYVSQLYYTLVTITFSQSALTKSLTQNDLTYRVDSRPESNYPVKRRAQTYIQPPFISTHEEQPDVEYLDATGKASRMRRLETSQDQQDTFRSDSKSLATGSTNKQEKIAKRDTKPFNHDEPYGIVYSNGKPLGILEPYPQAYEFSPLVSDKEGIEEIQPVPAVVRESRPPMMDMLYRTGRLSVPYHFEDGDIEASAKFSDEKYPTLLADLKIEDKQSSSKRENYQRSPARKLDRNELVPAGRNSVIKRETTRNIKQKAISDEKIAELRSALDKIQTRGSNQKTEEIEQNLRGILNDLGLIEDTKDEEPLKSKREVSDQNSLSRREIGKEDEDLEEEFKKRDTSDSELAKRDSGKDKEALGNSETSETLKRREVVKGRATKSNEEVAKSKRGALKVANYQKEGEAYIRSKRQESKTESSDIVKGLEKSGDLTVSGNKSPLAASESNDDSKSTSSEKFKREENEKYQKRLEQNIQAKIDAIKEQVKREIEELQSRNAQRQKRDAVNTLLEEETNALNPQLHPDEKLRPHIRRRRNLEKQIVMRRKRGLPDFSNLQNIDNGDYLDLTGEKPLRNERETRLEYQMDPREDQLVPEMYQTSKIKRESNVPDNAPTLYIRSAASENDLGDETRDTNSDYEYSEIVQNRNIRDVSADSTNSKLDNVNLQEATNQDSAIENLEKREPMLNELDHNKLLNKLHMLDELKREESKRNTDDLSDKTDGFSSAKKNEYIKRKSQEKEADTNSNSADKNKKEESTIALDKRNANINKDSNSNISKDGEFLNDDNEPPSLENDSTQKRSPVSSNHDDRILNLNENTASNTDEKRSPSLDEDSSRNLEELNPNLENDEPSKNNEKRSPMEFKTFPNNQKRSSNLYSADLLNANEKANPLLENNNIPIENEKRSLNAESDVSEDNNENKSKKLVSLVNLREERSASIENSKEVSGVDEKEKGVLHSENSANIAEKRSQVHEVSSLDTNKQSSESNSPINDEQKSPTSESVTSENTNERDCSYRSSRKPKEKFSTEIYSTAAAELVSKDYDDIKRGEENNYDDQNAKDKRNVQRAVENKSDFQIADKDSVEQALNSDEKTLHDLLDSSRLDRDVEAESNSQHTRKRRQFEDLQPNAVYSRFKRGNVQMPIANVAHIGYRANEDEEDDESEPEDLDRSAFMHKREANSDPLSLYDYDNSNDNDNTLIRKRAAEERYNKDPYKTPTEFEETPMYDNLPVRRRRHDFGEMAVVHGGGPTLHHLAAVRERNMQRPDDNSREKRTFKHKRDIESNNEPQKISDLSDTDLFGALPQSYDGELSRFKRIRR